MAHERVNESRGVPFLAPVMAAFADLHRGTRPSFRRWCSMPASPSRRSARRRQRAEKRSRGRCGNRLARAASPAPTSPSSLAWCLRASCRARPSNFDASRPNDKFDPFVQAILRQVGARLGLPFRCWCCTSPASQRRPRGPPSGMGLLPAPAGPGWPSLCQPVYELVLRNAVVRGRIDAPGSADPMLRAAWCGARWTGPSPGQIDPLKEVNAAKARLALRLSTRSRETAELTGDGGAGRDGVRGRRGVPREVGRRANR